MKQKKILASALMTALMAIPMVGYSATITQTFNSTSSSTDWNTALWAGAVPTAENDYVTDASLGSSGTSRLGTNVGGRVRDYTGSTFAGNSLTIVANSELLLKQTGNQTSTANIILDGGVLRLSAGTSSQATVAGTINVASESYLGVADNGSPVLTISSALTGSSLLHVASGLGAGTVVFNGDLSGFTGTLSFGGGDAAGTYDFDQDYDLSAASMVVNTLRTEVLNLDQAITVGSFMFGDSALSAGTYDVATLNSTFGTGTQFTGTGSIEVIPEPSTMALLGVMGGALVLVRRRCRK